MGQDGSHLGWGSGSIRINRKVYKYTCLRHFLFPQDSRGSGRQSQIAQLVMAVYFDKRYLSNYTMWYFYHSPPPTC